MTTYDPPGITDPENVDALTHQQIYDAFQTVAQSAGDVVAAWQQAGNQWRTSTTGLVQAVRSAVDGHWTGASADAAVSALVDYGNKAGELAELFEAAGQAVSNTAQAALTTKAYIPKPVPVSADQTKDPSGFDRETRDASKAQDDARQVMQQRYVTPFTDQDKRIPTFPAAVPVANGDASAPASDSETPATSTKPTAWSDGTQPSSTSPASVTSLLHDLPFPAAVDSALGRFLQDPSSATPNTSDVLFQQPVTSGPARADRHEGTPPSAATRPTNAPSESAPTTPSAVHPDAAAPASDGDQRDSTQQRPNSTPQQPDSEKPHTTSELPHTSPAQPTAPAQTQTQSIGTSTDAVRPGHDSAATPATGGSSANSAPPSNSTPAPSAPPAGSSGPVPGGSTPNLAGPALGSAGSAGSIPAIPSPIPSTPAPAPSAPVPNPPPPGAPAPVPNTPTPAPSFAAPAPNLPAPGANAPAPAPNGQAPAPGTSAPAPKPVPNTPVPGAPAAAQAAPARPMVNPLPPDVLAEPAAAAVTGAATAEVLSEPDHHHTGTDHRPPRLRVRFEGDRDRTGKKVDLRHESHTAEMAGRDEHVQPTIGE